MTTHYTLTGPWRLATDPANRGRVKGWFETVQPAAQAAPVPGIIQQVFPGYHGVVWYWLKFKPQIAQAPHERVLLRFGAVDYLAEVWLNGQSVGGHEGGETPFTLDVTGAFKSASENLLAVRVLNPVDAPIDGICLAETPHSQKGNSACGADFNTGGIVLPVELAVAPPVRITDVFAVPDIHTGEVHLSVTVRNDTSATVKGMLSLAIGPDNASVVSVETRIHWDVPTGASTRDVALTIPQPHLWNLDDPFLYRVHAVLTAPACHEHSVRFGFREFRVVGGYFHLNGRRIFLRSMHTAPFFPVVQLGAPDSDLMRRDMVYAKACGFNCVRFISKMPLPEQLDIADEIGIMVYAESYAGWWHLGGFNQKAAEVKNQEKVKQRFAAAIREMILRDRNHPALTIWGLLNEVPAGLITQQAVASLPLIRSLDKTRLVLLHSGRWDLQLDIGSLSNPGATEWECWWGTEGKKLKPGTNIQTPEHLENSGDVHYYPEYPISPEACARIRSMGGKARPVFLSEGGIGSALNAIAELKKYDEKPRLPANLEDRMFFQKIVEKFEADWKRFGMQNVYPFAEDMLRESQRIHASQRRRWFDLVRANPNLCGHSMTSMLDGTSGEGIWSFWREFKPGIVDVMRDGWAPLRWCLFVDPLHGYAGRPIQLEAVLANEDVLKPGKYPVTFRIWSRQGLVWEKRVTMNLPEKGKGGLPPLAVQALKETVKLKAAGEYTFAACLERGGAPAGDRLEFHVSDAAALPRPQGIVTVWGLEARVCKWLNRHGVGTRLFRKEDRPAREVLLVGAPNEQRPAFWQALFRRVASGAYAVFMDPELFEGNSWLPLTRKGKCVISRDWLYHKEAVAKAHPLFDGLPAPGILNWDYYDVVAGHHQFFELDDPDEVVVTSFATGLTPFGAHPDRMSYAAAVMVGEWRFGAGRFTVNGLNVIPNVDRHPAADRLLLNFIRHAQANALKPLARPPAECEERIRVMQPPLQTAGPQPDGNINLMPSQAMLRTSGGSPAVLSTNPDGSDRIGNWSNPKAKALWRMRLPQAGRYRVVIEQASSAEGAGNTYTLRLGKTTVKGRVQPTLKEWFDYVDVELGVISIAAGVSRVELARTTQGGIFMDVRRIRLVPVTGASRKGK